MFCPFGYPLRSLFSSSNRCKSALSASRRRANAHDTYPIEVLLTGESIMVHSDWQDRHVYGRSLDDERTEEPWDRSQSANARKGWRRDVCRLRTHSLLETKGVDARTERRRRIGTRGRLGWRNNGKEDRWKMPSLITCQTHVGIVVHYRSTYLSTCRRSLLAQENYAPLLTTALASEARRFEIV